jgi:uncharacterized pyridoxal phosphate-dependent enzyme
MRGILRELGVKPVINAAGTLTVLGGITIDPEVWEAMEEASQVFVDMEELHLKAGRAVAQFTGAEDGYITSGAFAALVLAVAACITRGDYERVVRLPDTAGMAREVVVQKPHRNFYDYSVQVAGGRIVEAGTSDRVTLRDIEAALSDQTACILYFVFDPQPGVVPLREVVELAHRHQLPVIADAAAETPPPENLRRLVEEGADLVVFSAGKDIGAPNDTGIIFGRAQWVRLVRDLGPQHYAQEGPSLRVFLGRGYKVSKEDIVGVVAALKRYLQLDHQARLKRFEERVDRMVEALNRVKGIEARKAWVGLGHPRPVSIPRVEVELIDIGMGPKEVVDRLYQGEPRIRIYTANGRLYISPQCLREEEDRIVIQRLIEVLTRNRP